MTDKTDIATLYAPAISKEIDPEAGASVTIQGQLAIDVDTTMPNPNLDFYWHDLGWVYARFGTVTINGREWELDARNEDIEIDWWLTADDVLESAAIRAAEDHTDTIVILDQWKNLPHAPFAATKAYEVKC